MVVSIIPFIRVLGLLTQLVYPGIVTLGVASEPKTTQTHARLIQWTLYWMIYAVWTLAESYLSYVPEYLPLYHELKWILFFWLASPKFQGAAWLWYCVIQDPASHHFAKLKEFVELHVHSVVKSLLPLSPPTTAPWQQPDAKVVAKTHQDVPMATVS
eukprot:Protomagalhaensia_wolfi_Nauph_80__1051@NODE_160_length_3372_cov_649_059106_g121_i0_p4_GENE_NODE_160_length_3372_cov_649_059106_g121_i0NODE_160_length_3372_cov_649_059106_g121_i0_p4_ORF_typecomplete_len157_score18_23TB2_DP1_HVA22/PF03134_19/5_7e13_NODE_160_length_3372_cov_649_059106_g121_i09681438